MTLPRGKVLLIGLTGGIASGKTEAANILKSLGAAVVSGDELGRWVMENIPEMLEWVRQTFGEECFDREGKLIRQKLGDLVFAHPEMRNKLDEKIFPYIYRRLQDEVKDKSKHRRVVVVDAAMIFEWGIEGDFDIVLTITAAQDAIFRRLSHRDGFDRIQMENRMASQISPKEKAARSHWIITNDSSLDELEKEVRRFWREIVEPHIEAD